MRYAYRILWGGVFVGGAVRWEREDGVSVDSDEEGEALAVSVAR